MLEGGERVIDACDGLFVWLDVEVADGVVDELGEGLARWLDCDSDLSRTVPGSSSSNIVASVFRLQFGGG